MPGEKLIELMQQTARNEYARSTPTDFVYGSVTSVSPLVIMVEGRFSVGEEKLVLSALVKPFVTTLLRHSHGSSCGGTDVQLDPVMVWRGLEEGDRVRMLQCHSGQTYYVLDREGSLP